MSSMVRDSVEYLVFTLTDRDGADLSGDAVQAALVPRGADPSAATWLPCTHVTDNRWRTTSPVTWSAAAYPDDYYLVFVKVTSSPETPRAQIGRVTIH